MTWSNWAGNVTGEATEVVSPASTEEVALRVRRAAEEGRRIRPIGSGHSFTAIGAPTDIQMRLDRLSGLVAVDQRTRRVRVRAGTPLHRLVKLLEVEGLALPNQGDIDAQTISGAVSTGTHGTGLSYTGMGSMVVGGEIVTGDGEVRRWGPGATADASSRSDDLPEQAMPISLGALGVFTELELQCVPRFLLHAQEEPDSLDAVLDDLDAHVLGSDHFEFFWFPYTDTVLAKHNTRMSGSFPVKPMPRWRSFVEDEVLATAGLELVSRSAVRLPKLAPRLNRIAAATQSPRSYTNVSHRVYASSRRVRFTESEFSLPREAAVEVLEELRAWIQRHRPGLAFPVEVRFTGPDDRWLSTSHERESVYIAVHQHHRGDDREYFAAFWDICRGYDARPHWGKRHDLGADELRAVYPHFDDFVALRDRLDPQRTFANPYLDRVLGA